MAKKWLSLALMVAMSLPAAAQTIFEIPPGKTVKIDRHNVCRMVENIGNFPFMVPTRTAEEWSVNASSFLRVQPEGMVAHPCNYEVVCPLASRNYSKVSSVTPELGQISPDGTEFIGVKENTLTVYARNGSNWTSKQSFSIDAGSQWKILPYRKFLGFSPDGKRALAIQSMTEDNVLSLIELNKNGSGVWSMQKKTVARNSPDATMISSVRFGEDADTVIFAWNTDVGSLPAATILKRGGGGAWSISGNLPRPSGTISPVDVWLLDEGTRAYLTGESENNNNFWISRTVEYRYSGGTWSISRNNPPAHTISADGLSGASADIVGTGNITPTGLTLYKRDSLSQPFQAVDTRAVSAGVFRPTMSDDGTTIAALEGAVMWPARALAFLNINDKLVSKGFVLPAGSNFMLDFPSLSATGDVIFNHGQMAHACAMP